MRLRIAHKTGYRFGTEIFLEPHYLRFRPASTSYIGVESYDLKVFPAPAGIKEIKDQENNLVQFAWFDQMTDRLNIEASSIINTREVNPFNFLIYPLDYEEIPFIYPDSIAPMVRPNLKTEVISQFIIDFGDILLKESQSKTAPFITNLTRQIHTDFEVVTRMEGVPNHPQITFEQKKGSCRDLAWMEIQILRHYGIATRFVSGYYYIPKETPEYELHAWLEAYLPGAGWIGFDPTNGLLAGNTHIPVAASTSYEHTMPVTGTFRGISSSELITSLCIEEIS